MRLAKLVACGVLVALSAQAATYRGVGGTLLTVWACGHEGLVVKSTDGGVSWTEWNLGTGALFDLDVSPSVIVVVGHNGAIRRTTDGGTTWNEIASGTSVTLKDVFVWTGANGVIVGYSGTILRTTNGGATWTSRPSGTTQNLHSVRGTGTGFMIAVGDYGTVLKSTDYGLNWSTIPRPTTEELYGVGFSNSNTIVACGTNGTIIRSTNGGASWSECLSGTSTLFDLFLIADWAVAVGQNGMIWHSTDAGATWTQREGHTTQTLYGVVMPTDPYWYAVGSADVILKSTDRGYTWGLPTGIEESAIGGHLLQRIDFNLDHNFPNPFGRRTTIRYSGLRVFVWVISARLHDFGPLRVVAESSSAPSAASTLRREARTLAAG